MQKQIEISSVVRLKSGGPQMTVQRIGVIRRTIQADCQWFSGNGYSRALFPLTSLVLDE
nr:DUF2158 domain-containing protein [Luteibacter rhizovicinus]